jgi:phosphopantothenate synthetase
MAGLIKGIIRATEKMTETQQTYQASAGALHQIIIDSKQQNQQLATDITTIKKLLREGFRLPPPPPGQE